jgi:dephospho-CoA kinase
MSDPLIDNKCLRVGITGGIGSGKSTVCRIFHEAFGIPVLYSDILAKRLLTLDPDLQARIIEVFGEDAYTSEGDYNRPYVAQIAFANPAKLAALNALVHPAVEAESMAWHARRAQAGFPYTLKEAALMIESGSHQHLDCLIVVTAPEALRIQRVVARDGLSEAQVRARLASQLPEAEKVKLADFVIVNDGEKMLIPQVWDLHQKILERRERFRRKDT